jgi:hypothetical protein
MPGGLFTLHNLAVTHVISALVAGAIAMLVVWLAMIAQNGLVQEEPGVGSRPCWSRRWSPWVGPFC